MKNLETHTTFNNGNAEVEIKTSDAEESDKKLQENLEKKEDKQDKKDFKKENKKEKEVHEKDAIKDDKKEIKDLEKDVKVDEKTEKKVAKSSYNDKGEYVPYEGPEPKDQVQYAAVPAEEQMQHKSFMSHCMADSKAYVNTEGLDKDRSYAACAIAYDQQYKTSYAPCFPGGGCVY